MLTAFVLYIYYMFYWNHVAQSFCYSACLHDFVSSEDELQPEMEENNPETSDGEEDNLEAQSSLHLSGV